MCIICRTGGGNLNCALLDRELELDQKHSANRIQLKLLDVIKGGVFVLNHISSIEGEEEFKGSSSLGLLYMLQLSTWV